MQEINDKVTKGQHFIDQLRREAADRKRNRPQQVFQDAIADTNRKLEKVEAMIAVRNPICQGVRKIIDASKLRQTEGQRETYLQHTEGQKRGYL